MIKLLSISFDPKHQTIQARVEDSEGKVRRIDVTWLSKEKTSLPSNWYEMVCMEVEEQRTQELNNRLGRTIL